MNQILHVIAALAAIAGAHRAALGQHDASSPAAAQDVRPVEPKIDAGWLPATPLHARLVSSASMSAPQSTSACHCRNCSPSGRRSMPFKSFLQRTHWGYCNYFQERPFGDALLVTMNQQVNRGSENMLMLYNYDFYPRQSQRAAELTHRGKTQLLKTAQRMQGTWAPIQIETTDGDPSLNQSRRQHVVAALAMLGLDSADEMVILGPQRYGAQAIEAVENAENLQQSIRSRGRSLRAAESPTFGGGFSSGIGN